MMNTDDGRLKNMDELNAQLTAGQEDPIKWVPIAVGEQVKVKGSPFQVKYVDVENQTLTLVSWHKAMRDKRDK